MTEVILTGDSDLVLSFSISINVCFVFLNHLMCARCKESAIVTKTVLMTALVMLLSVMCNYPCVMRMNMKDGGFLTFIIFELKENIKYLE